jgi:erythromycin esterase-like protein
LTTQQLGIEQTLTESDAQLAEEIKRVATPLTAGDSSGYDSLLDAIGDARIVMMGEASHGTHEFYRERALITKRLIEEKGFTFVGIEGAWPDVWRLNQYVQGGEGSARDAMAVFSRYPTWMWGNLDVLHFIEWFRRYNDTLPAGSRKAAFYGIDIRGLFDAISMVVSYLERVDPPFANEAREQYACFERFGGDLEAYGYAAGLGLVEKCERQANEVWAELQRRREDLIRAGGEDAYTFALIAASVVRNGERSSRAGYFGSESAWNIRDIHMQDTLDTLLDRLPGSKAIIWQHNTHVGDFRATGNADGQVNIGQLTRQRHPGEMFAIGFGTYEGSVSASRRRDQGPIFTRVPPAVPGTYENACHQTGLDRLMLLLKPLREAYQAGALNEWRGHRAMGIVYEPEYELHNHVPTRLADRYDAYIFIDRTKAVKPLDLSVADEASVPRWEAEHYPSGY